MRTQIKKTFIVPKEFAGVRLDLVVAKLLPEYSRSKLKSWIENGDLQVNNSVKKPKEKVFGDEIITLDAQIENEIHAAPEKISLNIVFEDKQIIVINKPAGMVVHPAAGNRSGTLLNALLHHCPDLAKLPRAGIIHRIDKDTSGLLVIAKTLSAHNFLIKEMQQRKIKREYEAIVYGELTGGGTIDAPIGRHPRNRLKMAVADSGKHAITHYRIIKRYQNFTHIKVILETGRTHQIRVHMAHINHPIVGDQVYGGRLKLPKNASPKLVEFLKNLKRQTLHAKKLGLIHPEKKDQIEWQAPLPEDIENLLHLLVDR